jgi:hypothetical protein
MTEAEGAAARAGEGDRLFLVCAGFALLVHAALLLSSHGLRAGEDMVAHLRLIEAMRESPGLHNTYAPAYHVLGALLAPLVGLAVYPRLFAFASAVALIFAFRAFQRAAELPAASAALFALSPYLCAMSWCIPKVEFMGHAVGLLGLTALLRRKYWGAALAVLAGFSVHIAATLVFGFVAGVLCLARRDVRGLVALAVGSLAAVPIFAAHLAAGCSLAQAFQFSSTGYLAPLKDMGATDWLRVLALASPLALVAAAAGAEPLWRRSRPLALVCLGALAFYLNDLWLLPFGIRSAAGLQRGLSVLAIPVAIAGGVAVSRWRPARVRAFLAVCAVWFVASVIWVLPGTCWVRPIDVAEANGLRVRRCEFAWGRIRPGVPRRPGAGRPVRPRPGPPPRR